MHVRPGIARGSLAALAVLPLAAAANVCMPKELVREHADWVAVGTLVERHERIIPYPNCALEDRSGCAQWDVSTIVVKVERWERGDGPAELRLVPAPCAGDSPRETGARYRFFGSATSAFEDQERVTGPLAPEPRLRILSPLPGARIKGKVEVVVKASGFAPCSRLALEIDGEAAGTFDRSATRLPLDTSPRKDGKHALTVSAEGCDGRAERASVEVVFENLFTLDAYDSERPWYQNGGWIGIEVRYGGEIDGLRLEAADFSGIDSGYVKGAEKVEPLGGGRFRIRYRLTPGNRVEDGKRPVKLVASSRRGRLAQELDVELRNAPPSPFEVATPSGRAVEIPEGYLKARPPDGPRVVTITQGDDETIIPGMPLQIGLRWEAGLRPKFLWLRPTGYSGLHRCWLEPGQTEATVEVTFLESTPEHRLGGRAERAADPDDRLRTVASRDEAARERGGAGAGDGRGADPSGPGCELTEGH